MRRMTLNFPSTSFFWVIDPSWAIEILEAAFFQIGLDKKAVIPPIQ